MGRAPTVAVLALVLLAGCSTTAAPSTPTPTETPEVVDREVTTGTISLQGLTVSPEFRIRSYDATWKFPTTIEFQRVEAGNWTEVYILRVEENEPIRPELVVGERYRIIVEDAEGDRRLLTSYMPRERDESHNLAIGSCCIDDFSGS